MRFRPRQIIAGCSLLCRTMDTWFTFEAERAIVTEPSMGPYPMDGWADGLRYSVSSYSVLRKVR